MQVVLVACLLCNHVVFRHAWFPRAWFEGQGLSRQQFQVGGIGQQHTHQGSMREPQKCSLGGSIRTARTPAATAFISQQKHAVTTWCEQYGRAASHATGLQRVGCTAPPTGRGASSVMHTVQQTRSIHLCKTATLRSSLTCRCAPLLACANPSATLTALSPVPPTPPYPLQVCATGDVYISHGNDPSEATLKALNDVLGLMQLKVRFVGGCAGGGA